MCPAVLPIQCSSLMEMEKNTFTVSIEAFHPNSIPGSKMEKSLPELPSHYKQLYNWRGIPNSCVWALDNREQRLWFPREEKPVRWSHQFPFVLCLWEISRLQWLEQSRVASLLSWRGCQNNPNQWLGHQRRQLCQAGTPQTFVRLPASPWPRVGLCICRERYPRIIQEQLLWSWEAKQCWDILEFQASQKGEISFIF